MKLRLRCLETKQTLKLDVPNTCSLSQLQQAVLSHTDISSSSQSSVYFSLNKNDSLRSSSRNDSLQYLGITSGDLVYFTRNSNAFSVPNFETLETLAGNQEGKIEAIDGGSGMPRRETREAVKGVDNPVGDWGKSVSNESVKIEEPRRENREILGEFEYPGGDSAESEGSEMSDEGSDVEEEQEGENLRGEEETENMDVEVEVDEGVVLGKKFCEQSFLRRVLREELGNDISSHKLVVIAVHAVFLEAGFIGFDSVSGMRVDRFYLADQWPSMAFGMSLWYTLPEVLGGRVRAVESVNLRFQSLGHFINVYGGLVSGGSGAYRVCLDESRFRPALDAVWGDRNLDGRVRQNYENEVFEFWKIVKDGLALPLLIDLCEKAGLMPPPCFMRLPTELKFKILESLPGVDVARVACVCSELQFLSSNNDLWLKKFVEEFGDDVHVQESVNWKEKFVLSWDLRKRRKRAIVPYQPRNCIAPRGQFRLPHYQRGPFGEVLGFGDHDRFPAPPRFRRRLPAGIGFLRDPARRNFAPSCNLGGGFNA